MSDDDDWRDRAVAVVTLSVLGAGFLAMLLGNAWFWMVWVLGFAVLVPLLAVLLGVDADTGSDVDPTEGRVTERSEGRDALGTLRDRYARGELTDEQFERKLERLLETETIEDLEDAGRGLDDGSVPDVETESRSGTDTAEEPER